MSTTAKQLLQEIHVRLQTATSAMLARSKELTEWSIRLSSLGIDEIPNWERQRDALRLEFEKARLFADTISAEFSAALAKCEIEARTDS